jgi:hypothetical protein
VHGEDGERIVAIKTLEDPDTHTVKEHKLELLAEALVMAQVAGNSNCVNLVGVNLDSSPYYMVLGKGYSD